MFVAMYHPDIPSTITKPVEVALQSVDDHAARGWLLVDPDEELPTPATPYYTTAAADSRFVRGTQLATKMAEHVGDGSAFDLAQRAASVAAVEDADEIVLTGEWDFTGATVLGIEGGGGGGGSGITPGTVAGQIPVWDGDSYEPQTPGAVTATDVPFTPGGSLAATNVQAALAELASEKLSASASVPTIVPPSGDATGAQDAVNINAALVAGDVILRGSYTIGTGIVMPSNRSLILWDADVARIPGTATGDAWVVVNKGVADNAYNTAGTITIADNDISVVGLGKSRLRVSDPTLWTRTGGAGTDLWKYIAVLFVKVTRCYVDNVDIGPTQAFGACLQGVTTGRVRRVNLRQDSTTPNQDGFDVGPGCTDIVFDGIYGTSGDDFFSVFAHTSAASQHPAVNATNAAGAAGDITDVAFRNVLCQAGINVFRLNCGDGRKLQRVSIDNITNRRTALSGGAFVQFGESIYTTVAATVANFTGVSIRNVRPGRMPFMKLDQNVSNVVVSGVHYERDILLLVSKNASVSLTHNNISISDVTYADPGTLGTIQDIVSVSQGTIAGLTLRNIHLIRCQRLLNNGATVTDLAVSGVYIGILGGTSAGSLIASTVAETGAMNDVWVRQYSGSFTGLYVGAAVKLRLGRDMPVLTSADVTPLATTKGSVVTFDNTKQADGGAGTTAAQWVANGAAWIKAVDLGAMAGR